MARYINKDKVVAEIDKLVDKGKYAEEYDCAYRDGINAVLHILKNRLDTLEVKEAEELASTAYVVTRCEEHSDYVESVFFDENKAQAYCDQFNGNENEYARHITKVEATL